MSRAKTPNPVRGERAVTIGGASVTVALTMDVLARLESAFDVDSFELVWPLLGRIEGEGDARQFFPSAGALVKFWQIVLDCHGLDRLEVARARGVMPVQLMIDAMSLRMAMTETWFGGDAKGGDVPLRDAGDGGSGSAAPAS